MSNKRVRLPDPSGFANATLALHRITADLARRVSELEDTVKDLVAHTEGLEERLTRHQERSG